MRGSAFLPTLLFVLANDWQPFGAIHNLYFLKQYVVTVVAVVIVVAPVVTNKFEIDLIHHRMTPIVMSFMIGCQVEMSPACALTVPVVVVVVVVV